MLFEVIVCDVNQPGVSLLESECPPILFPFTHEPASLPVATLNAPASTHESDATVET